MMAKKRIAPNRIKQLKTDTAALALAKGRRVGQPGHRVAREFLNRRVVEAGLVPWKSDSFSLGYRLPHPSTGRLQEFTNLIGVIPGRDRSLPPMLLGAHYDSVIDAPCADDNATSVALNLAVAEEFEAGELDRDLIIAFFDAEEPPHFYGETMGSLRFYKDHCKGMRFAGVIVSDLIGHDLSLEDFGIDLPGAGLLFPQVAKTLFVLGAESDRVFPEIVETAAASTSGLNVFPTLSRYVGAPSDHMAFEADQQPTLFLSCGRGRFYHDPRDTLDWINFKKLNRITEFTIRCLRKLDATPGSQTPAPTDSFAFEKRMISKALGPGLFALLPKFGITFPESREEMDELIGRLLQHQ